MTTALEDVNNHWEAPPLHSIEFPPSDDIKSYFDIIDEVRAEQDLWFRQKGMKNASSITEILKYFNFGLKKGSILRKTSICSAQKSYVKTHCVLMLPISPRRSKT